MFNNNFKTFLRQMIAVSSEASNSNVRSLINIKGGQDKDIYRLTATVSFPNTPISNSYCKAWQAQAAGTSTVTNTSTPKYFGVIIGKGSTPPTVEDYNLADPLNLTSGNSVDCISGGMISTSNGNDVNGVTVTVTPTESTGDLTIRELGLVTGYSDTYLCVMIAREVLPEDVIVKVGESKTFTMSIDFNNFIG